MLEKNENFCYFDAHFHLADCIRDSRVKHGNDTIDAFSLSGLTRQSAWYACACSHSIEEWEITERFITALQKGQEPLTTQLCLSYGLHPQSAGYINIEQNADFLEGLLSQHKLCAIGETGFDFFTDEFKVAALLQERIFNIQLELALQYKLPLVVHSRKSTDKLFEYSKQLKKLPAVLFHSFMGAPVQAKSLLDHGINAYFSFGKQVMNNNKKVIACVRELPAKVLLTETDAPFQFLKGETHTEPWEIKKIFSAFCELRNENELELARILKTNFYNLFMQNSNINW